jgi:polyhydroxybutyrate depolymerase
MKTHIGIGSLDRTYILDAPPSGTARNLVVVFHGSKQDADAFRSFTGDALSQLVRDDDTAIAYLDGYRGNWNDARRESRFPARRDDVDDVRFAREVVARLRESLGVGAGDVYGVGYSNGGQMVMRLLHEEPHLFAGALIVAATMPTPAGFLLSDATPADVPTVIVHGTHDRIVPFEGGRMAWWARAMFAVGGETLSAEQTAGYFARARGITDGPHRRPLPAASRSTHVERVAYSGGAASDVVLYTVHGGGHTIPGPTPSPRVLGRTSADLSLTEVLRADLGLGRIRSTP